MTEIKDLDKNLPILLVEQYASVRKIVKNCLSKLGFKNIVEAENRTDALERIAENKFELVISDWKLPDLEARELMQKMNVTAENVPFLILISQQEKTRLKPPAEIGKADFIVKPFTVETLEAKLSSLF